jgi:cytochrome c-type biogenesis protein CcmE
MPRPDSDPNPATAHQSGLSKGAQIAIGACLVAALLGWYGYTNLAGEATFQYYQNLDELRRAGSPARGQNMRVHGYVANDSIERDVAAKQVMFEVQNDPPHAAGSERGEPLRVVYKSLETPDLFKAGAEVVVEGRIEGRAGETLFVADNVMAKCPSKFEAKMDESQPL